MRIINVIAWCSLLTAATPAVAHDFWLAPGQYYYENASPVSVQFRIGHEEDTDNWNLRWDKIVALRNYASTGVTDMSANVIPKSELFPGVAKTDALKPGSYVIGFESYHSVSRLESGKFNSYVEGEGLSAIHEHRKSKGLENKTGTELYSRKSKTIVQVGTELSDFVTAPVGHTLEIVPLNHPYNLNRDGSLPVKVLFRGKPLQSARIDAVPLEEALHAKQTLQTDSEGKAIFRFSEDGPVKLNVIWGVPLINNSRADYETYFSSLTFAIKHQGE